MNSRDVESVAIVLFDGFDELDAIGPYEVFQTARDRGGDLTTSLCTRTNEDVVTASHGLRLEPDGTLEEADPDLLLVPGGGWGDRAENGVWGEVQRGDLPDAVASAAEEMPVASVCTGGLILGAAGLLDGRPAVTHASALGDLTEYGATVVDARVVDDGDVLTAGGVTAGLDLAHHLTSRICGAEIAETVAVEMEFEPRKSIHHGDR
jgi:transcriptional regulator GlxA family with amidase domain